MIPLPVFPRCAANALQEHVVEMGRIVIPYLLSNLWDGEIGFKKEFRGPGASGVDQVINRRCSVGVEKIRLR